MKARLVERQCIDLMKYDEKDCIKSCFQYFYPVILKGDANLQSSPVQEVMKTPYFPVWLQAKVAMSLNNTVNNLTSHTSMGGRKTEVQTYPGLGVFLSFIDFSLHSSFNQLSVKNEECIFNLCKNVLSVPKVLSVAIKHFPLQLCIHFLKQ